MHHAPSPRAASAAAPRTRPPCPLAELHDRLVDQGERRLRHRAVQGRLQSRRRIMPGAEHRLVAAPLPLARRLGRVQRQVGVPDQVTGAGGVIAGGHAHGGVGDGRADGQRERLLEGPARWRRPESLPRRCPAPSSMSSANSSPPSRAAVPAAAWSARTAARLRRPAARHRLCVPCVVDHLEVVQVDEEHLRRPSPLRRARALSPRPPAPANSIRLGSPVSESWKARYLSSPLKLALLGNVPQREHQAADGGLVLSDRCT